MEPVDLRKETEWYVLAGMYHYNQKVDLSPDDFTNETYRRVFTNFVRLLDEKKNLRESNMAEWIGGYITPSDCKNIIKITFATPEPKDVVRGVSQLKGEISF